MKAVESVNANKRIRLTTASPRLATSEADGAS